MVAVVDLKAGSEPAEEARGAHPNVVRAEREGAFAELAPYRDAAIFAGKFAGTSAWERHPMGDEIVQIVDGARGLHR